MAKLGKQMNLKKGLYLIIGLMLFFFFIIGCQTGEKSIKVKTVDNNIKLPTPQLKGNTSVEEALAKRRSRRKYKDGPLTLEEVGQILWAAQGITAEWGGRTAPSAGATYPLEIYLLVGEVKNLSAGLYHYLPSSHTLVKVIEGDLRAELASAALGQKMIEKAPITIVITAIFHRTTDKYGVRGNRYVHIEVGHVAENIYLQAEGLKLATVAVGAFNDEDVKKILQLKEEPLYIMPIGIRCDE